ncbi:hypothetical protein BHE74_00024313 [Ensete ventricosum]|nr:hypothetical protein BHE74_00024313 [Ensete ventricosum]
MDGQGFKRRHRLRRMERGRERHAHRREGRGRGRREHVRAVSESKGRKGAAGPLYSCRPCLGDTPPHPTPTSTSYCFAPSTTSSSSSSSSSLIGNASLVLLSSKWRPSPPAYPGLHALCSDQQKED